jgi:auxin-responsive protein IAA
MKSSLVASSLKQEQVDASKLQEGVLNNLELRLGISSDNGLSGGGGTTNPWLGVGVHPWSLSSRQDKAALEQAQQRPNECHIQRFGYQLVQSNSCFSAIFSCKHDFI